MYKESDGYSFSFILNPALIHSFSIDVEAILGWLWVG